MLTLEVARERIAGAVSCLAELGTDEVPVNSCGGRVLVENLVAIRAVPGFACSAMDGYAMRHAQALQAGNEGLPEDGVSLAGDAHIAPLAAGHCRRITTGTALPERADTVVVSEHSRRIEFTPGRPCIAFEPIPAAGANVRAADDDFAEGATPLRTGRRLDAVALAVAVVLGRSTLNVRSNPPVTVITTGNELLAAGAPWQSGRRYDSNATLLQGLLHDLGIPIAGHTRVPDHAATLRETLDRYCRQPGIVLVTGGVSAGEADHLPGVCAQAGSVLFWKLAFRPGMPALLARVDEALVFGLPGNPVSVLATFVALVRPALAQWMGCRELDPAPLRARLTGATAKRHDRMEWRRGTLGVDHDARLEVTPHPMLGSGAMRSLAESDVLLELPADCRSMAEGDVVDVRRWTTR